MATFPVSARSLNVLLSIPMAVALSACLFENRPDALPASVSESGTESSGDTTTGETAGGAVPTSVLEVSTAILERTCPAATVFVETGLQDSLLNSCASCHSSTSHSFHASESATPEDFFTELAAFVTDQSQGGSADLHLLVTKASGTSHSGGAIWTTTTPAYADLVEFVSAQLATPCDAEAALTEAGAAAAETTGGATATTGSSTSSSSSASGDSTGDDGTDGGPDEDF